MSSLPAVMKGVQLVGHGGPEKLVWNDAIPLPHPGPGEVLVRVRAAGVNNTDINTRIGWYARSVTGSTATAGEGPAAEEGGWAGALAFPRIQGGDLCGIVVAHGPGAAAPAIGRRVTCPINQPFPTPEEPMRFLAIGSEFDGAFAQYCVVAARQLHDVTEAPLTDAEVAALPCSHGTAFNLLRRAGVGAGDHVLITGASGGVGLAAVELASLLGAGVTALSAAAKADFVRAAGAGEVLDRDAPLPRRTFSAVIDVVGGTRFADCIGALRPGGRYAVSGAIAGAVVTADLRDIYLGDLTLYGCTHQSPQVFAELVALANAGRIRPRVARTYPLADIAAAQADFLAKRHAGKLVLIPPADGSDGP